MTEEEFIENLEGFEQEFEDAVIKYYREFKIERGKLAFERWKDDFSDFLNKYNKKEAEKFTSIVSHIKGINTNKGLNSFGVFLESYGNNCIAFIDELKEAVAKGKVKISQDEISQDKLPELIPENLSKKPDFKVINNMQSQKGSGNIFIGHGRSFVWRDLKDFLQDRLHLSFDEFNRESVAGVATKERLETMLENASFAFLVMTAEDEHADDTLHARENVIHEIGLFQGKLGFKKAIILLEEGCKEFTNIVGLGQIRFPKNNIAAKFEDIRRVLEREKIYEDKIATKIKTQTSHTKNINIPFNANKGNQQSSIYFVVTFSILNTNTEYDLTHLKDYFYQFFPNSLIRVIEQKDSFLVIAMLEPPIDKKSIIESIDLLKQEKNYTLNNCTITDIYGVVENI